MSRASCRYCPLYCASSETPVWGHCAGVFPPLKVQGITDSCPFNGDAPEITNVARARGFINHDLRGLQYYAVSEEGNRTRHYHDLDKLRHDLAGSRLRHTYYVVFIDSDRVPFYQAVIPEDRIT